MPQRYYLHQLLVVPISSRVDRTGKFHAHRTLPRIYVAQRCSHQQTVNASSGGTELRLRYPMVFSRTRGE
jgi:hypothetical protein